MMVAWQLIARDRFSKRSVPSGYDTIPFGRCTFYLRAEIAPYLRDHQRYTRLGKNCVRWARIATRGAIKSNAIIPQVVGRAKFRL